MLYRVQENMKKTQTEKETNIELTDLGPPNSTLIPPPPVAVAAVPTQSSGMISSPTSREQTTTSSPTETQTQTVTFSDAAKSTKAIVSVPQKLILPIKFAHSFKKMLDLKVVSWVLGLCF